MKSDKTSDSAVYTESDSEQFLGIASIKVICKSAAAYWISITRYAVRLGNYNGEFLRWLWSYGTMDLNVDVLTE